MLESNTDTTGYSKPKRINLEKLEAQLTEWDSRLDLIKARAENLQADARTELDHQIADLRKKRARAASRAQDIRDCVEQALKNLQTGAEKAWRDLEKTTESVVSDF